MLLLVQKWSDLQWYMSVVGPTVDHVCSQTYSGPCLWSDLQWTMSVVRPTMDHVCSQTYSGPWMPDWEDV